MALYGPRTSQPRSRSNSLVKSASGPPTPARGRTPTSAQRGARDAKPIITVEDLLDRILGELRKDPNGLDAAGFPGSLRDRVLKLMKNFHQGHRKGKAVEAGEDSALARAGYNVAELRIEELEAELVQHRSRTAALRSEMANMAMELEKAPHASRMNARELNEARATTAFVRTQLAETKSRLQQTEDRLQEAEAQWRLAEDRAMRAEWRVKSYTEEEQWTRLDFVKSSREHAGAGGAGDPPRMRVIKARVDREKAALEKKGPAWKPPGARGPTSAAANTPRGNMAASDAGSPTDSVSPRPAPRSISPAAKAAAAERPTPAPKAAEKPKAKPKPKPKQSAEGLICAYCNKPVDGSPPPKKVKKDPDSDPSVLELKKRQKEEMEKLKNLEREAADATAKHMAFRYNRIVSGRLMQRVLVRYRSLVQKIQTEKAKKVVEENYHNELAAIKEIEAKSADQQAANAEKMATAYHNRLCRELEKFLLSEWSAFTIKSLAFKMAQEQSNELAQLQAMNAKQMERGGEMAEQVADKWREKRDAMLLEELIDVWSRHTLEMRVQHKLDQEMEGLQAKREAELLAEEEHSEEVAEQMAKNYRAKIGKDLCRAVIGCWFRAAMTHARQIQVQQEISKLQDEQKGLQAQYDNLSEEKEEQLVQKYKRQLQKELMRCVFLDWMKDAMKGAAERKLEKELKALKVKDREHGDEIAEQMATQFKKRLEREIIRQCTGEWHVVTIKNKTMSTTDKELEALKEQHTREMEEMKHKIQEEAEEQMFHSRTEHEKELDKMKKQIQEGASEKEKEVEKLKRQLQNAQGQSAATGQQAEKEMEELQKKLAEAEEQQQLQELEMKKKLADMEEQKRLQELQEEEMERAMEEKTAERLAAKYRLKLAEMTLRRMNGAWVKVVRIAKTEAEKKRLEDQLHRDMEAQLEELRQQREQDLTELQQQRELELKEVMSKQATQKQQVDAQMEAERKQMEEERQQKMLQRAEKMADVQFKKRNMQFMSEIFSFWYHEQVAAAAARAKEETQKELAELRGQSRQRGGIIAEQMADRAYADYMASVMSAISRSWKDAVKTLVAERLVRNAEEQLEAERLRQEEILNKEKERLEKEKEQIKREQQKFQEKQMQKVEEELNQLMVMEREKGDHHAEAMATHFAKKRSYAKMASIAHVWEECTQKGKARREQEKHEKQVQAMKQQQQKELEEMKKQYAKMNKEKEQELRDQEAEHMCTAFHKRICHDLEGRCLHAWMKYAQNEKGLKEEKRRQEEFKAQLDRMAAEERERGDERAEQMADMQYAKRLDIWMRVIMSSWHEAWLAGEAEREQEVQKAKYQLELEKLKQQQREAGDDIAERMADEAAARLQIDMMREVFSALHEAVIQAHEALAESALKDKEDQLQKLREARAQEVEALHKEQMEMEAKLAQGEQMLEKEKELQAQKQREMIARADAQAQQMAEQYRLKAKLEKMLLLFSWWAEETRKSQQEKKEAKLRQAHDRELEEMKRQREHEVHRKEEFAEQMSERYYKKICQSILEKVLQAWLQWIDLEVAEREAQEQKKEAARELEELKRKAKLQGDRDAQQLAMQYERKIRADFLRDILAIWKQAIHEEQAEREKERVRKEQEAEIDKEKQAARLQVEAERHKLVVEYQKKLQQTLLLDIVDTWSDNVAAARAEKKQREAQEQMDAELRALKDQQRQKGDDTAKKLAEKFHKKICYEIQKEVFGPWRRVMLEEAAAKKVEKMKREQDDEMRRIKREQLNRLQDQANTVANNFRKKKLEVLCQRCVSSWRRAVLEGQAEKITIKLTKQCEKKLAEVQRKIDNLADWTATKFLKSKMVPTMQRIIFWWYHRFQLEVAEYEAQMKFEEEEARLEDDCARLQAVHAFQMDELSQQLVTQKGQTDKWLLLQRTMWGWSEARIAVKNEEFVAKAQWGFETDTADLARAQDRAKRELVITVSEWQLGHLKKPTMLCFTQIWRMTTLEARNRREILAVQREFELEAEAAKLARMKRSDRGLARMAEIIENSRNTGVQRRAFGIWRDEHWRETFIHVEWMRKQEKEVALKSLEAEHVKLIDSKTEVLGNFVERVGNNGALQMCVRYWYQTAWTSHILDRHTEQISGLQARHEEELTEAKEIVETQRTEMQVLRKNPAKVNGEDAKGSDSESRKGGGGPKKRLEAFQRDVHKVTSFKPRLRSSLANRMLDDFDEEGGGAAKLQDRLSKSKDGRRTRAAEAEEEAEEYAAERAAQQKSVANKERPSRKRFSFEQSGGKKTFSFEPKDGSGSSSDV